MKRDSSWSSDGNFVAQLNLTRAWAYLPWYFWFPVGSLQMFFRITRHNHEGHFLLKSIRTLTCFISESDKVYENPTILESDRKSVGPIILIMTCPFKLDRIPS